MLVNPILLDNIAGAYRVHCPILNRSIWPTSFSFRSEALRSIKVEFRDTVRDKFDVKHPSLIIKNLRKIIRQIHGVFFIYLQSTFFSLLLPFPSNYVFLLSFFLSVLISWFSPFDLLFSRFLSVLISLYGRFIEQPASIFSKFLNDTFFQS